MAKLYFKYGTMNSGKTIDIIRTAYNYEESGNKVLVAKPIIDKKGEEYLSSRIGIKRKVDYLIKDKDNIFEVIKKHDNIDVILIDEAQFLSDKQVEQLMKIVVLLEIPVLCYGLRTDFKGDLFSGSKKLLAISQSIEEIKTMCANGCKRKAVYNARYQEGKFVNSGDQVCIDNNKKVTYKAICPKCFYGESEKF